MAIHENRGRREGGARNECDVPVFVADSVSYTKIRYFFHYSRSSRVHEIESPDIIWLREVIPVRKSCRQSILGHSLYEMTAATSFSREVSKTHLKERSICEIGTQDRLEQRSKVE